MCIFVCIFYINNTAKGNTSLMLNKLLHALYIYLFIYTTFIKRSIHKQTCSNALYMICN